MTVTCPAPPAPASTLHPAAAGPALINSPLGGYVINLLFAATVVMFILGLFAMGPVV